ncbi:MAG TPA: ABC transporter substrate-binding protein, partial [Burkholderiales bacterium]|nr:ABC transporter substrate-binding protein [Burkholderiales bacterium]
MTDVCRRSVLRAFGAALGSSVAAALHPQHGLAADLRYQPEKGAQLKLLRWKRFVQGDEDAFTANTRKFTEQTGVPVQIESINTEEVRPKGALAASVGAGPDMVMGFPDMPQLYPDRCLDVTELAGYLGKKYGGWYDVCQRYCTVDGRWIGLALAINSFLIVYRESMIKAAGFTQIPRDLGGFLKLCKALKARGT